MFGQKDVPVPVNVKVKIFCQSSFPHSPTEEAKKTELVKEEKIVKRVVIRTTQQCITGNRSLYEKNFLIFILGIIIFT